MLRRLQARYMVTASGERSLVTLARDNLEWRKMKKNIAYGASSPPTSTVQCPFFCLKLSPECSYAGTRMQPSVV